MGTGQINAIDSGKILFHFRVGGELTAHTFPRIRRVLLQQLNYCRDIEVDFSGVTIVDAKSIRALLAIRRDALRQDKALYFVSSNEAFLEFLDSMNRTFSDADQAIDGKGLGNGHEVKSDLGDIIEYFTSVGETTRLHSVASVGKATAGLRQTV